tara:strand:- start:38 stop:706 length:669 start_codon:yes stop_codon:yes gene_type:complete
MSSNDVNDDGYEGESDTPKKEKVNSIQNFLDLFDPIFEFIEETTDKNKLYLCHVNRNYIENIQINLFKAYVFLYYTYYMLYGFWGAIFNAICPCWCVNSTRRSMKEVEDIFQEEEFTKIEEYNKLRIEAKIEKELRRYSDEYDDDDFEEYESEEKLQEKKEKEEETDQENTQGEEADNEEELNEDDNADNDDNEGSEDNEDNEDSDDKGIMTRLRKRKLNKQ